MSASYSYSISGDFPTGIISIGQFQDEILAESGITTLLIGVEVDDDDINVIFASPIGAEELLLDALVASHIPGSTSGSVSPSGAIVSIFTLINVVTPTRSTYIPVGRVVWNSLRYLNFTEGVCVFSTSIIDTGIDIQIWDLDNATELGVFSSVTSENNTFSIENPSSDTEIQIRVKKASNTGSTPSLRNCTVQFLN